MSALVACRLRQALGNGSSAPSRLWSHVLVVCGRWYWLFYRTGFDAFVSCWVPVLIPVNVFFYSRICFATILLNESLAHLKHVNAQAASDALATYARGPGHAGCDRWGSRIEESRANPRTPSTLATFPAASARASWPQRPNTGLRSFRILILQSHVGRADVWVVVILV